MMSNLHLTLLTLGGLLLMGLATDAIGRRTRLPRVTLLVLFGAAIGPPGFDLLPIVVEEWYPLFAGLALLMVGFLLGGRLSAATLRAKRREVLWISVFEVVGVALLVSIGLMLLGFDPVLALLLGGIGPASDPVATSDVVQQVRAKGPYTDVLLGVVAIDDAWGLIVFSLLLAAAEAMSGGGGVAETLAAGGWELGGALLIGDHARRRLGLSHGPDRARRAEPERGARRGVPVRRTGAVAARLLSALGDRGRRDGRQLRPPPHPSVPLDRGHRVAVHGAVLRACRRVAAGSTACCRSASSASSTLGCAPPDWSREHGWAAC